MVLPDTTRERCGTVVGLALCDCGFVVGAGEEYEWWRIAGARFVVVGSVLELRLCLLLVTVVEVFVSGLCPRADDAADVPGVRCSISGGPKPF